jgi:hypothetical protein
VPSTSKTIPFRGDALRSLVRAGSSGANLRGRPETLLFAEEDIDILKDVLRV